MRLPATLDDALDPVWLETVLTGLTGGAPLTAVEPVEVIRTVATKVRFRTTWDGGEAALCLKGFLDLGPEGARTGPTALTESRFYATIAPTLSVNVPVAVAPLAIAEPPGGILIMRDLVADGAIFGTVFDELVADDAFAGLDQLARLHAGGTRMGDWPWLESRVTQFAGGGVIDASSLQQLLDGERCTGLPEAVRSADRLLAGLTALAARNAAKPMTLVHGDCHAGNLYRIDGALGLIDWQLLQRGHWALDVAYHLAAVLPVEVAEAEERRLLAEYLSFALSYGVAVPDEATAWEDYRAAAVWGYFLWSITRKVEAATIARFMDRLGHAVARLQSYEVLDV